jgi:hypothetical protein
MVNSFGAHVLSPVMLVHSHLPPLYAVEYSHNQMSEIFVYEFILVSEGSSSLRVLKVCKILKTPDYLIVAYSYCQAQGSKVSENYSIPIRPQGVK